MSTDNNDSLESLGFVGASLSSEQREAIAGVLKSFADNARCLGPPGEVDVDDAIAAIEAEVQEVKQVMPQQPHDHTIEQLLLMLADAFADAGRNPEHWVAKAWAQGTHPRSLRDDLARLLATGGWVTFRQDPTAGTIVLRARATGVSGDLRGEVTREIALTAEPATTESLGLMLGIELRGLIDDALAAEQWVTADRSVSLGGTVEVRATSTVRDGEQLAFGVAMNAAEPGELVRVAMRLGDEPPLQQDVGGGEYSGGMPAEAARLEAERESGETDDN